MTSLLQSIRTNLGRYDEPRQRHILNFRDATANLNAIKAFCDEAPREIDAVSKAFCT